MRGLRNTIQSTQLVKTLDRRILPNISNQFKIFYQFNKPSISTPLLINSIGYAKKAKKGKKASEEESKDFEEKGKSKINEEVEFSTDPYETKFQNVITWFQKELNQLRIGRANPALLDGLKVDCGEDYGVLNITQIAQISIKDPQNLLVMAYDSKHLKPIEKAILEADMNLNPMVENNRLRVPIPKLTSQTRDQLVKQASTISDKAKVNIRNVRQSAMKVLSGLKKGKSGFSKDDVNELEKEIQSLTDKFNKEIDKVLTNKVKEIKS